MDPVDATTESGHPKTVGCSRFLGPRWMACYAVAVCLAATLWLVAERLQDRARIELLYQGLGRALAGYAEDHGGTLPPLDAQSGRLMFADTDLAPKYINPDACREAIGSEAPEEHFLRYYYPGYVLLSDKEVSALASALSSHPVPTLDQNGNLLVEPGSGNLGGSVVYRLGADALSRLASSDPERAKLAGRIPVVIARASAPYWRHRKCLVLFLDNHVEERQYPGDFPFSIDAQAGFAPLEWQLQGAGNRRRTLIEPDKGLISL